MGGRRGFIFAAAAWPALAWMDAARAQPKKPPVLIGWLSFNSREAGARSLAALKEGVTALGWKEGSQFRVEEAWADGQDERLASVSHELAAKKPALIVASTLRATAQAAKGAQGLVMLPVALFAPERPRILKFALALRWPVVGGSAWAEAGALLGYGADGLAQHRRAAYYVDRILKGTKPGDLPIEQPTKFELVVNLKTAKAIGLTISQDLLFRADRVIE